MILNTIAHNNLFYLVKSLSSAVISTSTNAGQYVVNIHLKNRNGKA